MNRDMMIQMGFGKEVAAVDVGLCPFCHEKVKMEDFEDKKSATEFLISGLCQKCQDETFGGSK